MTKQEQYKKLKLQLESLTGKKVKLIKEGNAVLPTTGDNLITLGKAVKAIDSEIRKLHLGPHFRMWSEHWTPDSDFAFGWNITPMKYPTTAEIEEELKSDILPKIQKIADKHAKLIFGKPKIINKNELSFGIKMTVIG